MKKVFLATTAAAFLAAGITAHAQSVEPVTNAEELIPQMSAQDVASGNDSDSVWAPALTLMFILLALWGSSGGKPI